MSQSKKTKVQLAPKLRRIKALYSAARSVSRIAGGGKEPDRETFDEMWTLTAIIGARIEELKKP
jgi:hypothetical protein